VTDVRVVLDTTALVAYMRETTDVVGSKIAAANDVGASVIVPATCLAQAYAESDSDTFHLLDVISDLPNVIVAPLERSHCSILGSWSRILGGSLDLAHAMMEAAAYRIVPILTSRGDQVRQVLPKEWPIISL
jgi:hypothetical protein